MKKIFLLLILCIFGSLSAQVNPAPQPNGIQTTWIKPYSTNRIGFGTSTPTAAFDFSATTGGFLFPRMTTAQRNAISSPAISTIIRNTTTNFYEYYNGSTWVVFGGSGNQTLDQTLVNGNTSLLDAKIGKLWIHDGSDYLWNIGHDTDSQFLIQNISFGDFLKIESNGYGLSFGSNSDESKLTFRNYGSDFVHRELLFDYSGIAPGTYNAIKSVAGIPADADGNVPLPLDTTYVKLAGTDSGSPVTGDIEMSSNHYLINNTISEGVISVIGFAADGSPEVIKNQDGYSTGTITETDQIGIFSNNPTFRGITAGSDYSSLITDYDYTQKKYVDDAISGIVGVETVTGPDVDSTTDPRNPYVSTPSLSRVLDSGFAAPENEIGISTISFYSAAESGYKNVLHGQYGFTITNPDTGASFALDNDRTSITLNNSGSGQLKQTYGGTSAIEMRYGDDIPTGTYSAPTTVEGQSAGTNGNVSLAAADVTVNSLDVTYDISAAGAIYSDSSRPNSILLQGVAGAGLVEYPAQSSFSSSPLSGYREYANSSGYPSFLTTSGKILSLNTSSMTGNVVLNVGNTSGTVATISYADAKVQNSLTASTTVAPSATAVNGGLATKEDTGNKITGTLTTSTTSYPASSLVKSVTDANAANIATNTTNIAANTTAISGKQGTLTNSVGLASALSDETGSTSGGLAVFNNSPTIISPSSTGLSTFTGTTATGSSTTGTINLTQTWNTTGVITGIKANFTNTASGFASKLMDLQLDGGSLFSFVKTGAFVASNGVNAGSGPSLGAYFSPSGNAFVFGAATVYDSNATATIAASGDFSTFRSAVSWAQSTGTATMTSFNGNPTINQTSVSNTIRGFWWHPTITAIVGENRAIDIESGKIVLSATNTATGTTGNQTINKISGKVNIAAAGTSITVTDNLVTANSIIICTVQTNDATAKLKNAVPGAGSFVVTLDAAATAETSIGFLVIN